MLCLELNLQTLEPDFKLKGGSQGLVPCGCRQQPDGRGREEADDGSKTADVPIKERDAVMRKGRSPL